MPVFIYGLRCPIDDCIRYIGKSDDPPRRLKHHIGLAPSKRGPKWKWLKGLIQRKLAPELLILRVLNDGESWADVEREEIARARALGWPLTNLTDGGEGAPLTDEGTKAKLVAMGRLETRQKMSIAAKARWADPQKRAAALAVHGSLETRTRKSERAHERSTPKYREMMAAKSKAAWSDPEKRARIVAGITPEVREKVSAASKEMWRSNEKAKASLDNINSPEARKRLAEIMGSPRVRQIQIQARSSPAYRKKASESQKLAWQRRKGN